MLKIKNIRQKIMVLAIVIVVIVALWQNSLLHTTLGNLFPVHHQMENNTLSSLDFIWFYSSDDKIIAPPKGNRDIVIVLNENGFLTALDNNSGRLVWEHDLGPSFNHLWSKNVFDLDENILITSRQNDKLVALDVQNGHEVWQITLPTFRTSPDILIVDSVVVVTVFSVESTEGYLAIHSLDDGSLIWDKTLPNRSYEHTFECPNILTFLDSVQQNSAETVCITFYDHLEIVDVSKDVENRVIGAIYQSFPSNDRPQFREGLIFTNPNPNPHPQAFDISQNRMIELSDNCSTEKASLPITFAEGEFLVATGCNELFIVDTDDLEAVSKWTYNSQFNVVSSFVSVNGKVGYVLNEQAEIVELDLQNGKFVGLFATKPNQLHKGQQNNLVANPPFLYSVMDNYTLFGFFEQ